jgi:8-oxo-dGTP pyrophosphatase MutT (NUDIX family)
MVEESIPRNAATVILTRDGTERGMEIFLMRRHREQTFMGGAFVFPGGSIDKGDSDPELASYIVGPTALEAMERLQEPGLSAAIAMGLYMAAIRETFEEAGVLLAYEENGRLLQLGDSALSAGYAEARLDTYNKRYTLKILAERKKIRFAFDLLMPYAHWITPTFEKKRFNTRFFIARIPADQVPLHDSIEMTESLWMTPKEALTAYRRREILLMPPTLKTLEELSPFDNTEALFREARQRKIYPIMPQADKIGDIPTLLLPHDPDYPIAEYKQLPRHGEPSRIVFRNKMWQTEMAE